MIIVYSFLIYKTYSHKLFHLGFKDLETRKIGRNYPHLVVKKLRPGEMARCLQS